MWAGNVKKKTMTTEFQAKKNPRHEKLFLTVNLFLENRSKTPFIKHVATPNFVTIFHSTLLVKNANSSTY
jgi:hypothetical protein